MPLTELDSALQKPGAEDTEILKKTLLVIDDEEGPRQSLRMVFKNDYHVHTVESGEKAIEYVRTHPVHAAILDIRMAGQSGIEVLRQIKAIAPSIEVIMLTAYETLETARQAIRLGACDYLNKPFDIATIRESVKRAARLRDISDNISATFDRFNSLTSELQDANLREEMARTANEIYAGVLHDINNPLTIISGFVEMLEMQLSRSTVVSGSALEEARGKLNIISKQVSTCGAITSRYLKLLKRTSEEGTTLSVNQILSDLISLLKSHPAIHSSKLVVKSLESDLQTPVNCTELLQVLINLSVNAFQSTPKSQTVEVSATRHDEPIDLASLPDGPDTHLLNPEHFLNQAPVLCITLTDQGDGIPSDRFARIFEPYFTTKGSQGGTGLGLSIVARLMKNARGMVWLQSRPGEGTCFKLFFPASNPES
ncbi:MAG: response regulator [Opitutaceae bacterium]